MADLVVAHAHGDLEQQPVIERQSHAASSSAPQTSSPALPGVIAFES